MDFSPSSLAAGLIFGVFGLYFFRRGKAEADVAKLGVGLVLMVYPYFVANPWLEWGIGSALLYWGYRMTRF